MNTPSKTKNVFGIKKSNINESKLVKAKGEQQKTILAVSHVRLEIKMLCKMFLCHSDGTTDFEY